MSNPNEPDVDATSNFPQYNSSTPGEKFEVRQTSTSEDYKPDPSKSLKLSPTRQALIDDIIALYSCKPTVERVKRYSPDCVYDDQFVVSRPSQQATSGLPVPIRGLLTLDHPELTKPHSTPTTATKWPANGLPSRIYSPRA